MILLRFFMIIFIGTILYLILLCLLRSYDGPYIKRRTGLFKAKPGSRGTGMILTYLIVLFLIIILSFAIIKLNIRGEVYN